jgi:hypothetical protein
LLYEAGVPIAVHIGGEVRYLAALDDAAQWVAKNMLIRPLRHEAAPPQGPGLAH